MCVFLSIFNVLNCLYVYPLSSTVTPHTTPCPPHTTPPPAPPHHHQKGLILTHPSDTDVPETSVVPQSRVKKAWTIFSSSCHWSSSGINIIIPLRTTGDRTPIYGSEEKAGRGRPCRPTTEELTRRDGWIMLESLRTASTRTGLLEWSRRLCRPASPPGGLSLLFFFQFSLLQAV